MDIHPNCLKCKLHEGCETPFMESSGSQNPIVLVVGEAPGALEDEQGIPFVGKAGRLLRTTLEDSGLDTNHDVRFTNVVRCRPPNNIISKRAINYCKHFVQELIAETEPDLVILLGNSPLNAILGQSGITNWNGVVVERDDSIYVPLFHPTYILKNPTAAESWLAGLDKALEVLLGDGDDNRTTIEYIYPKSLKDVRDMVDYLLNHDVIAYDTETASLDPFAKHNIIPCVSFAAGNRAYAVPLEHENSPLTGLSLEKAITLIGSVLTAPGPIIIGHNIKFDQLHTRAILDIEFEAQGDTMLVSHMLDSRRGIHSLKRLAGLHLGMYDYDKPLNDHIAVNPECNVRRGGSYANIPLDILLPYAAMDTEATLKLWNKLYPKLSSKQKRFYNEVVIEASNALAEMEYNGNPVDDYIASRYVELYERSQTSLYEKLLADTKVHAVVKHFQEVADDKIISDIEGRYDAHIHVGESYIHYKRNGGREGKRKRQLIEFNPNSTFHLRRLYFHEYCIPVLERTETGAPSTKATVMASQAGQYPIIRNVIHYKLLTKMLGTYLIPAATGKWTSGDGRVRSSYNLHGTRTGRLSSSNPNMQNIPTPEKEAGNFPQSVVVHLPVKNVFTHTFPDGVLMSVDYAGMELRVFASLAGCEPMLDIHRSGGDFHSMVAIMARTGRPVKNISKEESHKFKKEHHAIRYRYKWTNWTLLYGGDTYTLMSLYGMTNEEANDTVESYYDAFPEVLRYREECIEFAEDHDYIESPFGRREKLAYISDSFNKSHRNKDRRSAVNMPVQSAASDILLCALIVIRDRLYEEGLKTMLVNTVHDSIVLDVPKDEISIVADICVDVMENIAMYADEYFPSIDFSWLKCPLKADVEVGTHYGAEMNYSDWIIQ